MKTVFALLFALSVASAFPKLRRRLQVTESQLAAANSASNCWLAIGGRAYDCTAYANSNQHPGGARTIHAQCGNDVTTKFNNEGAHKRSFLDSRVTDLGPLVADPVNPITPPANPTPIATPLPTPAMVGGPPPTTPPIPCNNMGDGSDSSDDEGCMPAPAPNSAQVTQVELASHNSANSCWIQVNSNAYDVTGYASRHPGGANVIHAVCGMDATVVFYRIGDHETSDLQRAVNKGTVIAATPSLPPTPNPTLIISGPALPPSPNPTIDVASPTVPPTPNPTTATDKGITGAEFAAHNNAGSCWVQVGSNAYDVTSYAAGHPGGAGSIHAQCGNEITSMYYGAGAFHTLAALSSATIMGAVMADIGPTPEPTSHAPTSEPSRSPTFGPTPLQVGILKSDVAAHGTAASCWLEILGNAYDVTTYASSHPGGASAIHSQCGKEITNLFLSRVGVHTKLALAAAIDLGPVVQDAGTIAPNSTPTMPTTIQTPAPVNNPPTASPTPRPTLLPTIVLSVRPSVSASSTPSRLLSFSPSARPSSTPSDMPSKPPSISPSQLPSSSPSSGPSLLPSQVPSDMPSNTPSDDGICQDHIRGRFYVESTEQSEACEWLRARPKEQVAFCRPSHPNTAFWLCQETCKACEDFCTDEIDFQFLDHDNVTLRDCFWLRLRPHKHETLCVKDGVSEGCMETCSNCPTQPPTSAPCDDDLSSTFPTTLSGVQNCTWLLTRSSEEQQQLCDPQTGTALSICSESCGACHDFCEDSITETFTYEGGEYDCNWLAANVKVQPHVCYSFNDAWTACKDTCNHWSCGLDK